MRQLRKGESYGLAIPSEILSNISTEQRIAANQTVYLNDEQIVKYNYLLHVIAKEFRFTDFSEYRPTAVIDSFWSKYNCNNTELFNLFDMVLLAKRAADDRAGETKGLHGFLKDFLSYMIASHTVHYMNRSYRAIGSNLRPEQVDEIKEGVRLDFVGRLSGLR